MFSNRRFRYKDCKTVPMVDRQLNFNRIPPVTGVLTTNIIIFMSFDRLNRYAILNADDEFH